MVSKFLLSVGSRVHDDDATNNSVWDEDKNNKNNENVAKSSDKLAIDKNIACLSHEQVIVLHMVRNVFEDTMFASKIENILIKENNKSNNNIDEENIINLSNDFNNFFNLLANKISLVDINKLNFLSITKSVSSSSSSSITMNSISSIQEVNIIILCIVISNSYFINFNFYIIHYLSITRNYYMNQFLYVYL
jgi:hypothetical protein